MKNTLSRKTIFKADLFSVEEIKFLSLKGKKKIHHIAKRNSTVSVFPLTEAYDIYLVSQYRDILGKVALEAVAGFIDGNETTLAAAKRELKEEAGISAGQWEELARIEMVSSVFKGTNYLFLAKGLEETLQNLQDDEEIKVVKISLEDAVDKVMSGEINVSSSVIGILLLDKLRKEKKI